MRGEGVWDLPAGWDAAPLNGLVNIQSGFACSKKKLVPASEGVAHLRPFNVGTDGKVNLSEVYYIPSDFKDNVERYALEPGHILFNNTNSVELVGKTALVTKPMPATFSNHIYRLALKEKAERRLEPAWLALALRQLWAMGYFAEQCNRWIGQAGFNATKLKEVEIPLPPLDEQRRIVARIEAMFDRISEARRLRFAADQDAERLMPAVLADAFGAFGETDWPVEKLGELCTVCRGGSPRPKGDPKYFGGEIPWIMISDVTRESGKFLTHTRETLTKAGKAKSRHLEAGTLIVTNSATIGLPKILAIDGCIHDGFLAFLDLRPDLRRDYLYWFFWAHRSYLESIAPHGTQRNLNTGIARAINVPLPSLLEQDRIIEYLDGVQAQVAELRRLQSTSAAELERLSGAVLARAFRGEL